MIHESGIEGVLTHPHTYKRCFFFFFFCIYSSDDQEPPRPQSPKYVITPAKGVFHQNLMDSHASPRLQKGPRLQKHPAIAPKTYGFLFFNFCSEYQNFFVFFFFGLLRSRDGTEVPMASLYIHNLTQNSEMIIWVPAHPNPVNEKAHAS